MDGPTFHLMKGDAVTWLRALPPESIDLVVTDPPYESLEKHRAIGTTTRLKHSKASSNDWFSIFPNVRFPELFAEVYRVLRKNTHFYLYCDPETMFVAKPMAEQVGFKFWKPLIWDKCLGPDTLVWTERGVQRIEDIVVGDRVAIPEGGSSEVRATRRTRAPARKLTLSDGTQLVASYEHRFVLGNGSQIEAAKLEPGDVLCTRSVRQRINSELELDRVIPQDEAIFELPDVRADVESWYPRTVPLDYDLGRFVGLFAAEGSYTECGATFALHANEKHLQNHIANYARFLGVRSHRRLDGNKCVLEVSFKIVQHLLEWFVGGSNAPAKYLKPSVYAAPEAFRRGVLAGLQEGDGHWSHEEQRNTFVSSSPDLTMFVRRELEAWGRAPNVSRFENDAAGGWRVRYDPIQRAQPLTVETIEDLGEQDLIDVSIADRDELFLLANGVVTHNCSIGMGYHYRARYECILFFEKGKRKLNNLGTADIIEAKRVSGGYPAEKPTSVSEVLIRQSTEPGQIVIDPFMGSGSIGVAAVGLGRSFCGNDLCSEAVDITRGRLLTAGAREVSAAPSAAAIAQLGLQV